MVKQCAGEGAAIVYTTHYLTELTDLGATIAASPVASFTPQVSREPDTEAAARIATLAPDSQTAGVDFGPIYEWV